MPDLRLHDNPLSLRRDACAATNYEASSAERPRRNQTMFEKGLLGGKRILITGGGSGLGAAMGRRFLELGAELIICGRRLELLERTAADMREKSGGKVAVARCDIRDGAAVDAMMDA